MEKFLQDDTYANFFFILAVATIPFITIGISYETLVTTMAFILSGVFTVGLVICSILTKQISLAPEWIFIDLRSLFFPYTIALSTAIYSMDDGPFYIGYWFALGLAAVLIITNHLFPVRH